MEKEMEKDIEKILYSLHVTLWVPKTLPKGSCPSEMLNISTYDRKWYGSKAWRSQLFIECA